MVLLKTYKVQNYPKLHYLWDAFIFLCLRNRFFLTLGA